MNSNIAGEAVEAISQYPSISQVQLQRKPVIDTVDESDDTQ